MHSLADVALDLAIFDFVAFVAMGFALGDGNFHLGQATGKINPQGNQGEAFLDDFTLQFFDFTTMGQKFADSGGFMIDKIAVFVKGNGAANEEKFTVVNATISLFQIGPALAEAFDLGTGQGNSGFQLFQKMEIEAGLFVFDGGAVFIGTIRVFIGLFTHCLCLLCLVLFQAIADLSGS